MSSNVLVDYKINSLNRENGAAVFEVIATSLAEKEICSNIVPATGPMGGGDLGIDAKSHSSYVFDTSELFRIYRAEDKRTNKKLIFAYSIQEDWKTKVDKDVEKIVIKNELQPDEIFFITNRSIKTKDRELETKALFEKYKVKVEILDGEWVCNHLSGKHYRLAVQHLGLDQEQDPEIKELLTRIYSFVDGGMPSEEAVKVKELLERASYRSTYQGKMQLRVLDLKQAADKQAKYSKTIEGSLSSYEEAISEADNVDDYYLIADTYYNYFMALQKLHRYSEISNSMQAYRQYIFSKGLVTRYKAVLGWFMYLMPHVDTINGVTKEEFLKETQKQLAELKPQNKPKHIVASYDEAVLVCRTAMFVCGMTKDSPVQMLLSHLKKHRKVRLYPITKLSNSVTAMSRMFEGTEDYETLYNLMEEIILERDEEANAAQLRKDRAAVLFEAGRYPDVIFHLSIVKLKWYSSETIRGSLLSSYLLYCCYNKLGLHFAAIEELLTILHISTHDQEMLDEHKDLFVKSLGHISSSYTLAGLPGSAAIWGVTALSAKVAYDIEPGPQGHSFTTQFEHCLLSSLSVIRLSMPRFHARILEIVKPLPLPAIEMYKQCLYQSDEEFSEGWEGDEEAYKGALDFRAQLLNNTFEAPQIEGAQAPIDEMLPKRIYRFSYHEFNITIVTNLSYEGKMVGEYIAAFIQRVLVEIKRQSDFTWIENDIEITIDFSSTVERFAIIESDNNDLLDLIVRINPAVLDEFENEPYNIYIELERNLIISILMLATIDKTKDVEKYVKSLGDSGFLSHLFGRLQFGIPFTTFFRREDYEQITKDGS